MEVGVWKSTGPGVLGDLASNRQRTLRIPSAILPSCAALSTNPGRPPAASSARPTAGQCWPQGAADQPPAPVCSRSRTTHLGTDPGSHVDLRVRCSTVFLLTLIIPACSAACRESENRSRQQASNHAVCFNHVVPLFICHDDSFYGLFGRRAFLGIARTYPPARRRCPPVGRFDEDSRRLQLIAEELFTNTVAHGFGHDSEAPVRLELERHAFRHHAAL